MNYKNSVRSDLILNKNYQFKKNKNVDIYNYEENNKNYRVIYFTHIDEVKETFKRELVGFINKLNLNESFHVFVVGLGNDAHTPDSVGPKTLKYIVPNSYLKSLGLNPKIIVSLLEPGTLGNTGIEAKRIIESVKDEIKPDFIILIDSYICNDIKYLNSTIQITDDGITPGSGLVGLNSEISKKTVGIPVIVIGVPTAIEIDKYDYLMCSKDIDTYVNNISKIIGTSINEILYDK